jgi:uncharacterized membrane protein YuzA (DUF378 family)
MKFLIPLLSFFLGNAKNFFREPSQAITQQVVMHARAITLLAICAIGSLALSCVGISLFIANLAAQLDGPGEFHFTSGTYLYLGMTVVFVIALIFTMRKETWSKSVGGGEKKEAPKKGSPIENAIALVVMDFLEERQQRRESSKNENRSA